MMRMLSPARRRFTSALAALTCGVSIVGCSGTDADVGRAWPSVNVIDVDGSSVSTGTWRGQPLVVNFWYSTCAPCAKELRDFAEVESSMGGEVRFIGVNPLDDVDTMTSFAAERGVRYDLYRDELADLQSTLELTSFPATFFVTSAGEIGVVQGVLDGSTLRTEIEDLLAADQT